MPSVLRPFPFAAAVDHFQAEKRAQIAADLPSFREDDLVCENVVPVESVGLKRFRLYEETLENGFGHNWRRERVQREYHNLCANGLASLILGDDWERDGPELCRTRKWGFRSQLVCCKLPRRFGKSVATAMVMAALAVAFSVYPPGENFTIGSFSTGKRASSGLADYCLQLLQAAGMMERVIKHNQETVWLRTGEPGDEGAPVIKINFYPSNRKISSLFYFRFSSSSRGETASPFGMRPLSHSEEVTSARTVRSAYPAHADRSSGVDRLPPAGNLNESRRCRRCMTSPPSSSSRQ